MNIQNTETIREVEFRYPKEPWFFAALCHLIIFGFFNFLYAGRIITTKELPFGYLGAVVIYLSLVVPALILPILFRGSVVLKEDGIKVRKNFIKWEEIEKINHGPWPLGADIVRFKLKKQKRTFLESIFKSEKQNLTIPAYPFVYRDLIPAIRSIRPDLPVSRRIDKAVAHPENIHLLKRWFVLAALFLNIIVLNLILMPFCQTFFYYFSLSFILLFISHFDSLMESDYKGTEKRQFIRFVFLCTFLIMFSAVFRFYSNMRYFETAVLVSVILTAQVLGIFVLFGIKQPTNYSKAFILIALIGIPAGTYHYMKSNEWPVKHINSQICGEEPDRAVWGNSGNNITIAWYGGEGCLIDSESMERKMLPVHEGKILTVWLDERILVRETRLTDSNTDSNNGKLVKELWVYDFKQQQEYKVPASTRFSIGRRRPVDFDDRYLAWVDYGEDERQKLRFWNIETIKEDRQSVELPKDVNWTGGQAMWTGEKELSVFVKRGDGKNKNEKTRLYVLRINLENGEQHLLKSSQKYDNWYPLGNFKYACGVNEIKDDKFSSELVDLQNDQIKPLEGKDIPLEARNTKFIFHIAEETMVSYLMRFEYEKKVDQRVCRVPRGMRLRGVSPTGRYAIVGHEKFLSFPDYEVVDVNKERRHKMYLSGFSSDTPAFTAYMAGVLPFSPDEHHLILETLIAEGSQTFLFDIPENW